MLDGENRIFIPKSEPHDMRATWVTAHQAFRTLRGNTWSEVVSTGSLPAVPFLTLARAKGIPCHFIESAARVDGPSLSAKILERVPGVHRYCQYQSWSGRSWSFRGSVFDGFGVADRPRGAIRRVVVTLGFNNYGFPRLIDALLKAVPSDAEVLWQTGSTDVSGRGIACRPQLPQRELFEAMCDADVVVAHAGVGSAIMAMRAGRSPVLVPRRRAHGEHVDDHQVQIVTELGRSGLVQPCEPEDLTEDFLLEAASRVVVSNEDATPFVLGSN